jgi:enoyl-CoA hydratase/carnithine racemase
MAEPEPVHYQCSTDGITIITLDRAARRNAVNPATAVKLYEAFLRFEQDATQKVCVFCGAHGTFCAGFDLHHLSDADDDVHHPETPGAHSYVGRVQGRDIGPMGPSRMTIAKPVICAVSGYAVAGGLELSLLGDMRVVEEDAVFGVFCRRWGVPLIDGGTVRLQKIVGFGRAMDMILTGRGVGAQEAFAIGLANRVVAKGKALEEALKIARMVAGFPQQCVNVDRQSCYYAAYGASSLEDALAYEFEHGIKAVDAEGINGAARFSQGKGRHGML